VITRLLRSDSDFGAAGFSSHSPPSVGWGSLTSICPLAGFGLDAPKVWFSETHHWGVIVGCTLFYIAAGPAFFKSGPFPYHGLLAFYLPVIIWGVCITLTTWYMLTELRRAPERPKIPEPMGRT
jgi:hypothetical protein